MGRRKVKRRLNVPRRQPGVERRFNCPVCNHENVIQCTIKRNPMKGYAHCSECEASFVCDADRLTTGIDVYSAWVDQCYKG